MDSRIANSTGSDAADPSQIGAGQNSIDRNELFAGLFFLGCERHRCKSCRGRPSRRMARRRDRHVRCQRHRAGRLRVWSLVDDAAPRKAVTPVDLVVGVVALVLIALPVGGLSWIVVSGLALYILLFADADLPVRSGALILVATAVPMFWSRLLFQFFAKLILEIDASLVGWLLRT